MVSWPIGFIFYRKRKADKLSEILVFEDFTTELFSLLASVVHGLFFLRWWWTLTLLWAMAGSPPRSQLQVVQSRDCVI